MSDEYQAYKHFCLEVPISTNNIFINDKHKPAFTDDFFDNDVLKIFLHIGSAVYMPIIKDSDSTVTKRADIRIGTLYDIDLLSRTITIELDTVHKGKEIGNMLSEIDDNTFHYYAGLNIYVRLDRFGPKVKSNIFLLRVSHHDDEMKPKANAEHNSECDSPFSPSIVAENDSDGAEEKINNIDASPFLTKEEAAKTYLIHNSIDLSNYYTKSQVDALIKQQNINNSSLADEINSRYDDNIIMPITSSNIESWVAKYIYSDQDRFNSNISCGTKVTIQNGTYNTQWLVVGANTELNKGDVPLTKPHLSLIPVVNLGDGYMNSSSTSAGAYVGSYMNKETIPKIVAALQKVLGDHLLARRVKLANSIDGNYKSNGSAYYTVYANLLCERQIWGKSKYENEYDVGDDTEALPGFKNYKDKIYGSSDFWLRSVYDNHSFVFADSDGSVYYHGNAHGSHGVRPLIAIG